MKAVILDDEPDSISLLQLTLMRHCPRISHITSFTDPVRALEELGIIRPDICFLDIEMPHMNGFELLQRLAPVPFHIIFVTAFNQYAVKAFRMNALDYLVKPINAEELVEAVERCIITEKPHIRQLELAHRQMQGEPVTKIAMYTQAGISFVTIEDILYAEASNNYTILIMQDGKRMVVSKTLKDVQEVLEQLHFLRIHRQYIINLNQVKSFNRNDSILIMTDGSELPVARGQKEKLMGKYRSL